MTAGKRDHEDAALAQLAFDRYGAAMRGSDGLGKAQTQAGAGLGPASVAAIKSLENVGKVLFGYPYPGVPDGDNDLASFPPKRNSHHSPGGCIFQRIIEKIGNHALKPWCVSCHEMA